MADIRIKDLTTTASSTASDDFIAVDGTTNGTRKLNAFSPTFGGNATVTGTLTVNGATAFVGANTGSPYVLIKGGSSGTNGGGSLVVENGSGGSVIGIGNVSAIAGGAYNNDPVVWYAGSESLRFYNASTEVANFSSTGVLSLLSTTASTTTSTGALVVGNGTSGGLGVGGAANIGGTLTVNGTGASSFAGRLAIGASALSDRMFYVSGSTGTTGASQFSAVVNPTIPNTVTTSAYGLYLGTNIAAGATVTNGYSLFIAAPDYTGSTVTNKYGLYSNDPNPSYFVGRVLIDNSTASTSTSSGALVVSGGVGVAGAIYAGGDLTVDKTEPTITFKRAANTNLNIVNFWTGVNADFGIGLRNTSDSDLHIYNYGTSNDALKIAKADSLATFGGGVRTAAPSGGTAANWKLGTVATVSPTSPNRTIEVDIGGTIYYIHAKTTNN